MTESDWTKKQPMPLAVIPETQLIPPLLNEVNCGPCQFSASAVDPEVLERMFRDHNCEPFKLDPEPPRWHESVFKFLRTFVGWAGFVALAYILVAADGRLPWLWTN